MKEIFYRYAFVLLWAGMLLSTSLIVQQFVLKQSTMLHHAMICTLIFALSAYLLQKNKDNKSAKIGVGFAVIGMCFGLYELFSMLVHIRG